MHTFRGIRFLKATSTDEATREESKNGDDVNDADGVEEGREAREFYESIIQTPSPASSSLEPSTSVSKNHHRVLRKKQGIRKRKPGSICSESDKHVVLKYSQEGDMKGLRTKLNENNNLVNATDQFLWTPLMCAACAGHEDVVQCLLRRGADVNHVDNCGRNVIDIAKSKKQWSIVKLLESYTEEGVPVRSKPNLRDRKESFWCSVCGMTFNSCTPSKHESSTVHNFSCQHNPVPSLYYISEGNRGFQLLLKEGWDKEKGLGPRGKEGKKFPVKTILKRDRQGLGANTDPSTKARITHFKPYDISAIKKPKKNEDAPKMRQSTLMKHNKKATEIKSKAFEMEFRQSFNLE